MPLWFAKDSNLASAWGTGAAPPCLARTRSRSRSRRRAPAAAGSEPKAEAGAREEGGSRPPAIGARWTPKAAGAVSRLDVQRRLSALMAKEVAEDERELRRRWRSALMAKEPTAKAPASSPRRPPLPGKEPSLDAEGWMIVGNEASEVRLRVVQAEGIPDVICVKCTAEGRKAYRVAPVGEAHDLFEQEKLDDSKILTWDPLSPMHLGVKAKMQKEQSAKMQSVHDQLKCLLGNSTYLMLRTHDIGALAWTAGLAGTPTARYRCARLAMMLLHYAINGDVHPLGTEAHKELMQAARRLFAARTCAL